MKSELTYYRINAGHLFKVFIDLPIVCGTCDRSPSLDLTDHWFYFYTQRQGKSKFMFEYVHLRKEKRKSVNQMRLKFTKNILWYVLRISCQIMVPVIRHKVKFINLQCAVSLLQNLSLLKLWGQVRSLFCKKEFYVHENKTHFHIKGFTLNLVLKQRFDATQKWPIRPSGILRNWNKRFIIF